MHVKLLECGVYKANYGPYTAYAMSMTEAVIALLKLLDATIHE